VGVRIFVSYFHGLELKLFETVSCYRQEGGKQTNHFISRMTLRKNHPNIFFKKVRYLIFKRSNMRYLLQELQTVKDGLPMLKDTFDCYEINHRISKLCEISYIFWQRIIN
jgi:hypothetical protein